MTWRRLPNARRNGSAANALDVAGGSRPLGYREFRPLGPGPVLSFREDESRVRAGDAPENLAIIRHAALTLLRKDRKSKTAIKARRKLAGWDNDCLLSILSN